MSRVALLYFGLMLIATFTLVAQSPPDLKNDIAPSNGFNTVDDIMATYNNARMQEEIQFNIPANSIKKLILPDQATWDGLSHDQQALYLLNDERTSRAGVNYGGGAVKGLPFEGVGTLIDQAAQAHSQFLFNSNQFLHCAPAPTNCPNNRITNAVGAGCQQFIAYSENLGALFTTIQNFVFASGIADRIYDWNYVDSDQGWGHRRMDFHQGFNDDHGDANKEGIIGVGVYTGTGYFGFNSGFLFTLNYYDPAPTCTETLLVDTDDLPNPCAGAVLTLTGAIANGTHDGTTINARGTITTAFDVKLKAKTACELSGEFNVEALAMFEIEITGCN